MLDGRVKTLHPEGARRHPRAARRCRRTCRRSQSTAFPPSTSSSSTSIRSRRPSRRPDCTLDEAIENIDIGGPTMVRAAAKNSQHVAVVIDPADYAAAARGNAGRERRDQRGDALRARAQGVLATPPPTTARSATTSPRATVDGKRAAISRPAQPQFRQGRRTCATARIRTSRPRSTATERRRRARSRAIGSCRARSCRTTTSPTPMPRGNA